MIDIQETDNKNLLIVVCRDGKVIIDRRVYEQKLGTLSSCETKKEVFNLAKSSHKYLCKMYSDKINYPTYI
jgi:hypothetical protein